MSVENTCVVDPYPEWSKYPLTERRFQFKNLKEDWFDRWERDLGANGPIHWTLQARRLEDWLVFIKSWDESGAVRGDTVSWVRRCWSCHLTLEDFNHEPHEDALKKIPWGGLEDRWRMLLNMMRRSRSVSQASSGDLIQWSSEEWGAIQKALEVMRLKDFPLLISKSQGLKGLPFFGNSNQLNPDRVLLYSLIHQAEQDPLTPSIWTAFFFYQHMHDLKLEAGFRYQKAKTPEERQLHIKRLFLWDLWEVGFANPQVGVPQLNTSIFRKSQGNMTFEAFKKARWDALEIMVGMPSVLSRAWGLDRANWSRLHQRVKEGDWEQSWNVFLAKTTPLDWQTAVDTSLALFEQEQKSWPGWLEEWVHRRPEQWMADFFTPEEKEKDVLRYYLNLSPIGFHQEGLARLQQKAFEACVWPEFEGPGVQKAAKNRRLREMMDPTNTRPLKLIAGIEDPSVWLEEGQQQIERQQDDCYDPKIRHAFETLDWSFFYQFSSLHSWLEVCLTRVSITVGAQVWGKEWGLKKALGSMDSVAVGAGEIESKEIESKEIESKESKVLISKNKKRL